MPVVGNCMIDFGIIFLLTEAMEAEKKKASQTDSVESYEAAFQRIKVGLFISLYNLTTIRHHDKDIFCTISRRSQMKKI